MEFSEQQQLKLDKVLSFLDEYDTLDYDQYKQAILKNDELVDYWLCNEDKCADIAKKNLRKDLPKYSRLSVESYSNDGDHESFESCNICAKYLNKYLTWYEDELDYLIEECKTKEDIIEESNAFKIVGLLQSTRWLSDSLNSEKAKQKLLLFIDMIFSFNGVS